MDVAKKRDREWETWREFRSCKSKLIHRNYLEAMRHAKAVENRCHSWEMIQIYPCEFCEGIHIGRGTPTSKLLRRTKYGFKKLTRIMADPMFQAKAPERVKQRMVAIRAKLMLELEEYEKENKMFKDADLEGNKEIKGVQYGASAFQSRP